ncbi:MAG: flagellar hook-length control protein FliK [Paracoccaceae bacterium]
MVVQTIAQAAVALSDRPVELLLNPEELGRVRLTLQAIDGSMAVTITVERPETLDLLRRHIDQLAGQLRDIGYQKLTFEFADQGQQFDRQNDRDFNPQDPAQDLPERLPDAQNPEPHRLEIGSESGVDIRL